MENNSFSFEHLYSRVMEVKDSHELRVYQSTIGDVGCVIWDAALALGKFLELVSSIDPDNIPPTSGSLYKYLVTQMNASLAENGVVLELGAGTGYVGLVAATLGAQSIITDLPGFVDLMKHNIATNEEVIRQCRGTCRALPLVWGSDDARNAEIQRPKIILMADCIYYEESLDSLVKTLVDLSDLDTVVVCCHEERTTDNKPRIQKQFFQKVAEHFDTERVPRDLQDDVYSSDDIHIDVFRRKLR